MNDLESVKVGLVLIAIVGGAVLILGSIAAGLWAGNIRNLVDAALNQAIEARDRADRLKTEHDLACKAGDECTAEQDAKLATFKAELAETDRFADEIDAKLAEHTATELRNLEADRKHHVETETGIEAMHALQADLEHRVGVGEALIRALMASLSKRLDALEARPAFDLEAFAEGALPAMRDRLDTLDRALVSLKRSMAANVQSITVMGNDLVRHHRSLRAASEALNQERSS